MTSEDLNPNLIRVQARKRIDNLCDQFEQCLTENKRPDVQSMLQQIPEAFHDEIIWEFFNVELELDPSLRPNELRRRYLDLLPEQANLINEIVADFELTEELPDNTKVAAGIQFVSTKDWIGEKIDQYQVEEKIGEGGFGKVYLARDLLLPRKVVIKIPHRVTDDESASDKFLEEARNAALLNHANILKVFHVGTHQKTPFIVQEYFAGGDLKSALLDGLFEPRRTVSFLAKVATAMGYAHQYRVIHRDLKPSNILINDAGDPVIADFGLALFEPRIRGRDGDRVGTLRYMSPEQIRGEAHRLDGGTDIWSIGIMMYFMLTGEYPFDAVEDRDLTTAILDGSFLPPSHIDNSISSDLEQICMKCLAPIRSDRYSSAYHLADALQQWLAGTKRKSKLSSNRRFTPKGLTAFDASDRDFFLELLPGPYDEDGLPESIRFWKDRIENEAFSNPVNVIYGPSGCGKSSLVHAGLLPILADKILYFSVESTENDTEVRILKALKKRFPSIPSKWPLPSVISEIRSGNLVPTHQRVVIILDQFEQWINGNIIDDSNQLIHAMRHCDGDRVQFLMLVREDFWMGITRLFKVLEIDLVERKNFNNVDLLDFRHARKLLIKFGHAFGCLPKEKTPLTEAQQQFIHKSIELLAHRGQVSCVQLVLFAETFKNERWENSTLGRVGSGKNVGTLFLDQSFGESARYENRNLEEPSARILECLLPDTNVEIKGRFRSRSEIGYMAGKNVSEKQIDEALQFLDRGLRLITPTWPDFGKNSPVDSNDSDTYYQLTHDYLVPAVRSWLNLRMGRSRQGRARARLKELATGWVATKQNRYLPSFFEFCSIIRNVPRHLWSQSEFEVIDRSAKQFTLRGLITGLVIGLLLFGFSKMQNARTDSLVDQAINCEPELLIEVVDQLKPYLASAENRLRSAMDVKEAENNRRRILLVLAMLGKCSDEEIDSLLDSIPQFEAANCQNLFVAMEDNRLAKNKLKLRIFESSSHDSGWYRMNWLHFSLDDQAAMNSIFEFEDDPTDQATMVHRFKSWHCNLDNWVNRLDKLTGQPEVFSSICKSLGSLRPENFGPETRSKFIDIVEEHFVDHPSAEVHGAARWVLNNWQLPLPQVKPDTRLPVANDKWWVNRQGLTMIRIPCGLIPNAMSQSAKPDYVNQPFYISSCEITKRLFHKFLSDPNAEASIDLHSNLINADLTPINNISIEDAIMFCNWLSVQNDLQPAYQKCPRSNALSPIVNWQLLPGAGGYRLPKFAEWDMAARGGKISSKYIYGSSPYFSGARDYVWCTENTDRPMLVGHRMPNNLGVFDILGNVEEYCCEGNTLLSDPSSYLYTGGRSYSNSILFSFMARQGNGMAKGFRLNHMRKKTDGFRVVLPISD